jgi:hypothetical protein
MLKFRKMRNGASGASAELSGDEQFTQVRACPREGEDR